MLVVLGTDAGDEGSDAILAGLAQGLAVQAGGVVVAGATSDGGEGQLGRLRARTRSQPPWRRVDGVDTAAGRVRAVLTLAALADDSGWGVRCVGCGRSRPPRVG